jgi:hypothetical protein
MVLVGKKCLIGLTASIHKASCLAWFVSLCLLDGYRACPGPLGAVKECKTGLQVPSRCSTVTIS